MNILLIFFAIPLATIILSAIFETFINCPFKVAGIFFSIFIVVAFALGGTAELIVAAIVYTLISFITAVIIRLIITRRCNRCNNSCSNICNECNTCNECNLCNNGNANNTFSDNAFSLNNLNRIAALGINNDSINNSFPEETTTTTTTTFNSNTNGNLCRRYR